MVKIKAVVAQRPGEARIKKKKVTGWVSGKKGME
jgi:hypothetical protein